MFYQSIELVLKYFDYEIVTRFEVQEIKSIPTILIYKNSPKTLRMAKELIKIYPELKRFSPSRLAKSEDLEKFKRKLLSENKWNDFQRIVGSEEIIKTCHLMIDNKVINFSRFEPGIANFAGRLGFFNYLNFSSIDKNKIDSIAISLFDGNEYTVNLEPFNINENLFEVNNHFRHKLTFWSFLTQKLSFNDQNCISQESVKDFNDEYFEFCEQDTYLKIANETYGCFPSRGIWVYIERDIKRNGHKFCNDSYVVDSNLGEKVVKIRETKCKPKCYFNNFEFKLEVTKHISNKTILEFIPKKSPRIAYIETLKTNLDRLIYNCGGIYGLWFGLTPIKVVDLLQFQNRLSTYLGEKRTRITHYLLSIFKRCISFTIATLFTFIHNLCAKFSLISKMLIAFCIRCFQTSFSYFVSFVYQLIAVFKVCINFTITISYRFVRNLFAKLSLISHNLIALCIGCVQKSFSYLILIVYQLIEIYRRIKLLIHNILHFNH
jgi:hypothetical protein